MVGCLLNVEFQRFTKACTATNKELSNTPEVVIEFSVGCIRCDYAATTPTEYLNTLFEATVLSSGKWTLKYSLLSQRCCISGL